jgi:ComF family protein
MGRVVAALAGSPGLLVRWVLDPVLAAVFPGWCPACGEPVDRPTRGPLCEACWSGFPRLPGVPCRCGFPLPEGLELCGRCRRGQGVLDRGACLGPYEGPLRVAVHELKYRGRRRVARRLGELLLESPRVRETLEGAVVVEVPLHPSRLRSRGFNQAGLLADSLADGAGLRRPGGVLVRRRETPPQTGLSAASRRRNVDGAFAVRRRASVVGRAVVLVDDVMTTGATLRACARALRRAGAREVRAVTAARVF